MKQADKKKWVKALRSGKYEKGEGALRDYNDKYCCLGVACEIFGIEAKKVAPSGDGGYESGYQYDLSLGLLPDVLQERLGLTSEGNLPKSVLLNGLALKSLVSLNDSGASFKRIASVIERLF